MAARLWARCGALASLYWCTAPSLFLMALFASLDVTQSVRVTFDVESTDSPLEQGLPRCVCVSEFFPLSVSLMQYIVLVLYIRLAGQLAATLSGLCAVWLTLCICTLPACSYPSRPFPAAFVPSKVIEASSPTFSSLVSDLARVRLRTAELQSQRLPEMKSSSGGKGECVRLVSVYRTLHPRAWGR